MVKLKTNKKFIYLSSPIIWKPSNDAKRYIIRVASGSGKKEYGSAISGGQGMLVFSYIGWILEQVGEVCDTSGKIDNWFDVKERS